MGHSLHPETVKLHLKKHLKIQKVMIISYLVKRHSTINIISNSRYIKKLHLYHTIFD